MFGVIYTKHMLLGASVFAALLLFIFYIFFSLIDLYL